MKILVDANGDLHYVYSDSLDKIVDKRLTAGKVVTRATDVEYNHKTKQWEAHLRTGRMIAHGVNRNEVIEAEKKELEHLMEVNNGEYFILSSG